MRGEAWANLESSGWDDYTILLTLAFVTVGKAFVFVEVANALGRHKATVAIGAYKTYLKYDLLDWLQVRLSTSTSTPALAAHLPSHDQIDVG